jgi:hypothetical protein
MVPSNGVPNAYYLKHIALAVAAGCQMSARHKSDLWGRLVSCGRLSIGQLPHMRIS